MKKIKKGDTARRGGEVAEVTYVSPTEDYAELRYRTGFAFRARASEWVVAHPEGDPRNTDPDALSFVRLPESPA